MESLAEKYWSRWRDCVDRSRYIEWKEIQEELAAEAKFAIENDMETEFWCVNCKYSECKIHKQRYNQNTNFQKSKGCIGKTQRGHDCHFNITSYICGKFYCKYHR